MAAALLAVGYEAVIKSKEFRPAFFDMQRQVDAAIQSFQTLGLRVPAKSTMLILDDPLPRYDLAVIAQVVLRDPTLLVWTVKTGQPAPDPNGLKAYDYLFRMESNRIQVLKSRPAPQ